jgi:signal peptidase I
MRYVCIVPLIALILSGCGPKSFVQKSSSMEPTIKADETIQVQENAYRSSRPQRWDVVAFTPPIYSVAAASKTDDLGIWIFRIVGIPGDIVSFDDAGLLINGTTPSDRPSLIKSIQYKETTASGVPSRPRSPSYPFTVPDGQYFVLGDNPDHANDSRVWGPLPWSSILGRVENK